MTHVDGDEFQQSVLCENGHDDFVASLGVVVQKGYTACMGLNEELSSIV